MILKGKILEAADAYIHDVGGVTLAGARAAFYREALLKRAAIAMIEKLRDALEATT